MVSFNTLTIIYGALSLLTGADASACKTNTPSTGNPHGDTIPCLRYVDTTAELRLEDSTCGERHLKFPPDHVSSAYGDLPAESLDACSASCDQAATCNSFSYDPTSCSLHDETIDDLGLVTGEYEPVWYDKSCFYCLRVVPT
ncbi:hypothetical protein EDB81DRAFT_942805 [Dactylonectria macrodidyma]|uniref:Apple domain-containing protein n=1 Tax=Dactylonectria macrodidyma TaxID=307937 RepID=A0A9P9JMQ6_9HYPO|nr:hypothetical protein EDB81DRAFT_942805 [Dactylonectria macrodidyma]